MGDLEKMFVGTLVITGLLILALFGLYFDIGDMVAGAFTEARPTYSADMDLIRERRRASYHQPKNTKRAKLLSSSEPRQRPSGPANYARFLIRRPRPPFNVLMDREVRRLKRKGYVDEEFLRMRAHYEVDKSLIAVFDQYDRLVDSNQYDEAIRILLEAKEDLDRENLLGEKDLLRYLYQAYLLAEKDSDANQIVKELTDVQEKILEIEERAEVYRDNAGKEYVRKLRQGLGRLRQSSQALDDNPDLRERISEMARKAERGEAIELPTESALQNFKAQLLQNKDIPKEKYREILKNVRVGNWKDF